MTDKQFSFWWCLSIVLAVIGVIAMFQVATNIFAWLMVASPAIVAIFDARGFPESQLAEEDDA